MPLAQFGRFQTLREIGSGAMGQVFLASDPNDLQPVAIKLLKNPLPALEARFKREFRVLQRLESPFVVRVLEFGESRQGSYLVMEFIEGNELHTWQGNPPVDADGLLRTIRLAGKLAAGLEVVHRSGVIHRDLKPENILVTLDDTPKLTDFGLARDSEASMALTMAAGGGFLGTLLYAPPEQIQGRELDHRADLYALGMILFRLLTGRAAFAGKDLSQLILAHVREPVVDVRTLNPNVPEALANLIKSLVAKSPADRPESAAQVQAILETVTHELETNGLQTRGQVSNAADLGGQFDFGQPGLTVPLPASLSRMNAGESVWQNASIWGTLVGGTLDGAMLLEAPFVGREALIGELLARNNRALLLEGEAGVGKTRMLRELIQEFSLDGWHVLEASPTAGVQMPLEVLRAWVQAALKLARSRAPDRLQTLLETDAGILANLIPELGAATILSGEAQFQLFSSALRLLALEPRSLFTLDGLERIDEGSLAFVAFALRSQLTANSTSSTGSQFGTLEPSQARLLLASRLELPARSKATLKALRDENLLVTQSLEPLNEADTALLVRGMLGGACDEALIEHVTTRSRGNPWMTAEIMRGLVASGAVFKRRRFWEWNRQEDNLSDDLREVFEARVQQLGPEAQTLLGVAGVIGESLEFEELRELSGRNEDDVLDDLEQLIRAKLLLEERRGRTEVYRFTHPLLRETILAGVSNRKLRKLHERYAGMLETRKAEPGVLAHHFAQAGLGDLAATHALEFARQAEAVFALGDAESIVRAALEAFPEDLEVEDASLRPRLELMLGRIHTLTGRSVEAESTLEPILARVKNFPDLERETRLALAELYQRTSRWTDAIALLESDIDSSTSPRAWSLLLSCLRFAGRASEALERADQAESLVASDPSWQATLAQQRASALLSLGKIDQAHAQASRAMALAEHLENPLLLSRALVTLGRLERQLGHADLALEHYRAARTQLARVGDGRGEATVEVNIATALSAQRDFDETLPHLQHALVLAERGEYRDLIAAIHTNLFNITAQLGHLETALEHANLAIQNLTELGDARGLARAWYARALAELALGTDPGASLEHAGLAADLWRELAFIQAWWNIPRDNAKAVMILEMLRDTDQAHVETQLTLVEALRMNGQTELARTTLETIPQEPDTRGARLGLEVLLGLKDATWNEVRYRLEMDGAWLWRVMLEPHFLGAAREVDQVAVSNP
jgi:tetratricopeptide (TPR) repeat protein/predicted Ser/Thr protein kinase